MEPEHSPLALLKITNAQELGESRDVFDRRCQGGIFFVVRLGPCKRADKSRSPIEPIENPRGIPNFSGLFLWSGVQAGLMIPLQPALADKREGG